MKTSPQGGVGVQHAVGPKTTDLGIEGEGKRFYHQRVTEKDRRPGDRGPGLTQRRQIQNHDVLEGEALRDRIQSGRGLPHGVLAHAQCSELGLKVFAPNLPSDQGEPGHENQGRTDRPENALHVCGDQSLPAHFDH
jgi:hypothetical protein